MTKIIIQSNQLIDHHTSASDLVALLVKNRQIEKISDFLHPPFPQLKLELKKAVSLVEKTIANNGQILIYGDYDVDGITATAILWQAIYKKYLKVTPFIPNRQKDGYGLKAESFFRFQQEKNIIFDLLITVDNGIVAQKEIAKIKKQQPQTKIIITDHHLANGPLKTDALVHSTKISGSAVSWFLASQFDTGADLGLAALGTVADCLPLTDINRSIAVHGLQSLRLNPSPGIKKLIQVSGVKIDSLSVYDLGFALGPRINAVGRLADPTEALRLLCSQNSIQATRYAQSLNSHNSDRQLLQKESLDIAEKTVDLSNKLIYIYQPEFNPGIIGLIASRLTEKYYLPSIIIGSDNGVAKGSCRSIPELNIINALRQFDDQFIDLGGHPGAAGFSIDPKNIPILKKKITKFVNQKFKNIDLQPTTTVDAQMDLSAVSLKNIKAIQELAPFGIGNPEPLFIFKNLEITNKRILGQTGDHLRLDFGGVSGIAFKKGELNNTLKTGDKVDVVASLNINVWNNVSTPQLIIKEITVLD